MIPLDPLTARERDMSEQTTGQIDWDAIQRLGGPYPREAYDFVREGLTFTAELMFAREHSPTLS